MVTQLQLFFTTSKIGRATHGWHVPPMGGITTHARRRGPRPPRVQSRAHQRLGLSRVHSGIGRRQGTLPNPLLRAWVVMPPMGGTADFGGRGKSPSWATTIYSATEHNLSRHVAKYESLTPTHRGARPSPLHPNAAHGWRVGGVAALGPLLRVGVGVVSPS